MNNIDAALKTYQAAIKKLKPAFHVVLGSGFGSALDDVASGWRDDGRLGFHEVPGLPRSTVQDHAGEFRFFTHPNGSSVIFQCGRLHGYEGHDARLAILPVMLSRHSGVERFLLTNAAGGVDPAHRPGDVMLIRDHVNMTGQNPLVGKNPTSPAGAELGPRFPDMSQAYDADWRAGLKKAIEKNGVRVHEGIYMGLLGPSFETPAEVKLFGSWGVQAVGMSTVWETIALRHSGARVAGLSLISNAASGLGDGAPLEHETIVATCRASAKKIVTSLLDWLSIEVEKA